MTKINFVDLEKLYNFVVEKFFIWIHLGPQKLLWKNDLPRAKKNAHGKMPLCRVPEKGTRQRRILPSTEKWHSVKYIFAECWKKNTRQSHLCRVFFFLPSVFYLALGKDRLCRVPDKIHSAKPPALGKVPVSGSEKKESTMIQPEGTRSLLNMLLSTSSSSPMHADNGNVHG